MFFIHCNRTSHNPNVVRKCHTTKLHTFMTSNGLENMLMLHHMASARSAPGWTQQFPQKWCFVWHACQHVHPRRVNAMLLSNVQQVLPVQICYRLAVEASISLNLGRCLTWTSLSSSHRLCSSDMSTITLSYGICSFNCQTQSGAWKMVELALPHTFNLDRSLTATD